MSDTPSFYQSDLDVMRLDFKYINETRYPEVLENGSVFSIIARFTPLNEFDSEGNPLLEKYKMWCHSVGTWVIVMDNDLPKYVLAVRQANTGGVV